MGNNPLREVLNRLRWQGEGEDPAVTVVVRVRRAGAEGEEVLPFAELRAVTAGGIIAQDDTFIPFHRIVAVRRGSFRLWPEEGTK